jgi:hypothetical protein
MPVLAQQGNKCLGQEKSAVKNDSALDLRLLILLTVKTCLIRMLGWHAYQGHLDLLNNQ